MLIALDIWVGAAGVGNGAPVGLGAVAAILALVLALRPRASHAVTLPPIRTMARAAATRTLTRGLTAARADSCQGRCSTAWTGCGVSPCPASSSGSAGRSASAAERVARRLALFVARGTGCGVSPFPASSSWSACRGVSAPSCSLIPAASSPSRLRGLGEMGGIHVLCKALVIPRQYHSNFCCTSSERGSWWRSSRQSRYWRVATIFRIGSSRQSFSSSSLGPVCKGSEKPDRRGRALIRAPEMPGIRMHNAGSLVPAA